MVIICRCEARWAGDASSRLTACSLVWKDDELAGLLLLLPAAADVRAVICDNRMSDGSVADEAFHLLRLPSALYNATSSLLHRLLVLLIVFPELLGLITNCREMFL